MKLENNHTVYILGAGFSAARGLPVMSNFMLEMRNALYHCIDHAGFDAAKSIENVLKFRLDAASAAYRINLDLENIEQLFSLADAQDGTLNRDIRIAISETIQFCRDSYPEKKCSFATSLSEKKRIPEHWFRGMRGGSEATFECPQYEFLAWVMLGRAENLVRDQKTTFVTFNYDLLLEDALRKIGSGVQYGFEDVSISDKSNRILSKNIAVLKLHGSMNWAIESSSQKLCVYDGYSELVEAEQVPMIVPPTWRKTFSDGLSDVWSNTLDAIGTATRIVVVGFSMPQTDLHFKYLLGAGLKDNISLRNIVFVDPSADSVRERAEQIFTSPMSRLGVEFVSSTAEDFFCNGNHRETSAFVNAGVGVWIKDLVVDNRYPGSRH